MAIKEIEIRQVTVADGGVVADIKALTANGNVGMRLVFGVKNEPEMAAAISLLEDAIDKAISKTLGVPAPEGAKEEVTS